MKGLRIGYVPLSPDLTSPGDRRRLIFWANQRGHAITTDLNQKIDLVVASETTDFRAKYFTKRKVPLIFDLVDGYLSPRSKSEDFARGAAKKFSGQISGTMKPFSHLVRDFCQESDGVICSSIEQKNLVDQYNPNVHVILDSHDELPLIEPRILKVDTSNKRRILWEGQPATLKSVGKLIEDISYVNTNKDWHFSLVTDEEYYKYLNRFLKRTSLSLLEKNYPNTVKQFSISKWTIKNLVTLAQSSSVSIIPIDLLVPIQNMKPENRLLIMWRLGLPCLTSASPAYLRTAKQAEVKSCCETSSDWVESLDELLNNPTLAFEHVQRGQNYLSEHHSRRILLDKWDRAVESVLD